MEYYGSYEFKHIKEETRKQYVYFSRIIMDSSLDSTKLGNYQLQNISTKMCKVVYRDWCDRGVSLANHVLSVAKIILNYAIDREHIESNPFRSVKRQVTKQRKVVWSKDDIKKFLDCAYSKFETRNVGLIAQMAYEWCQRIGDMRLLKWDHIDFDNKRVHILQSKRRAEVYLPISDNLLEMLQQQHNDFGFQEYVAPRPNPIQGKYEPYTIFKMSKHGRALIKRAGLPDNLRLSDLRRTGTTEMVQAGVGIGQIMSVTGHANPQSVKPYIKNTFDAANYALTKRNRHDISTLDAEQEEDIYNV